MDKKFVALTIFTAILLGTTQANAGIFSRVKNWFNTPWDNSNQQTCPCYNNGYNNGYNRGYNKGVHNGNPSKRGAFNNGAVTGFTPPIVPSIGNYHSPQYPNGNGRFDHFPNGTVPTVNSAPEQMFTDFSSNVGTRTGITIID